IGDLVSKVEETETHTSHSVELRAFRDEDGRGFAVNIVCTNKAQDSKNAMSWNYSESVLVNGKSISGSGGGTGFGQETLAIALADFIVSVHEALSSAP